jgi:hypothetical protein
MVQQRENYERLIKVCQTLVNRFGENIVVRKKLDPAATSTVTNWRPGAPTIVDYSTVGVFLPNGIRGPFTLARKRGEDVAHSDINCYLPGNVFGLEDYTTRMDLTDIIIRADGTHFGLSSIDFLWPGGLRPTYYEARVKR